MSSTEFAYTSPDIPMDILESVLTPGFRDTVRMPSGNTLNIQVDDSNIKILDGQFGFCAGILDTEDSISVSFSIQSVDRRSGNMRHPDLYAGRLITRSLAYFENRLAKQVISYWLAGWKIQDTSVSPPSDNYLEFLDNVREGDSLIKAARKTWTGRQADKHGFSEIVTLGKNKDDRHLIVVFARPNAKGPNDQNTAPDPLASD